MFSQNGLSLDQAPPISVVFRFFFSGALFGMLSGVFILFYQSNVFKEGSIAAIILTHTLTLGVMLSFMIGALFQMLPVIAGVKLTSPVRKANLIQYPLILGILSLLLAFFFLGTPWLFWVASLLLGTTLLYLGTVMLSGLIQLPNHSPSSRGMLITLLSLMIVTLLALYLTASFGGLTESKYFSEVKKAHYSFGLFGWVALLIISISFQVIEMFYVTPPYPKIVSRYLPLTLLGLLTVTSIASFFSADLQTASDILLALLLGGYALLTLRRLTQKKRPLTDATVWFWRIGLGSLVLSMFAMVTAHFTDAATVKTASYLFFTLFALSIVFAMFYKIIPFLTWFHLNAQGYFTAPMMHEVIHPKTATKHLYIHLATIAAFVLAIFIPKAILAAGALMILSFGWITYQIIHAHLLYKKTQMTGEKFDMGSAL